MQRMRSSSKKKKKQKKQTCWFLTIQSLEFQDIRQNNSSGPTWMIYDEKSEFWHREFLIIQKTI